MKSRLIHLFIMLLSCIVMQAQDFEIVSVESLPSDMSAREEIKTDHNDRQCALLRVATQNIAPNQREAFSFVPDLGSEVVERATRDGEIWLWVSPGLKYLRIKHRDWGQSRFPAFAIREARISAFAMRENNDMRLPWYDSPTAQRWGCRADTLNETLPVRIVF